MDVHVCINAWFGVELQNEKGSCLAPLDPPVSMTTSWPSPHYHASLSTFPRGWEPGNYISQIPCRRDFGVGCVDQTARKEEQRSPPTVADRSGDECQAVCAAAGDRQAWQSSTLGLQVAELLGGGFL